MPAKSKAQQKFMGMVHAAQMGEKAASPAVAEAAASMSKKSAKDFAGTTHAGLPEHKGPPRRRLRRVHVDDSIKKKSF
jgi:hypothetical protein